MSAVAPERCEARTLFDEAGGESILDDVLVRVWEGLIAHRVVDCPVCGSEMQPQYGAQARPAGGRCRDCGTTIA